MNAETTQERMTGKRSRKTRNTQQKLLVAIAAYQQQNGFSPTIRDLQAACGINTTSVVVYHLERLRKRGMVDWIDGAARTIHVVRKAS